MTNVGLMCVFMQEKKNEGSHGSMNLGGDLEGDPDLM